MSTTGPLPSALSGEALLKEWNGTPLHPCGGIPCVVRRIRNRISSIPSPHENTAASAAKHLSIRSVHVHFYHLVPETCSALDLDDALRQKALNIATSFKGAGEVKDLRYRLKKYSKVFVASAFVDWAVATGFAADRHEAVQLGHYLVAGNVIHHSHDDHDFKDEYLFFRYREDDAACGISGPDVMTVLADAKATERYCKHGWLRYREGRSAAANYFILLDNDPPTLYRYKDEISSAPETTIRLQPHLTLTVSATGTHSGPGFGINFVIVDTGDVKANVVAFASSAEDQSSWIDAFLENGAAEVAAHFEPVPNVYGFEALDIHKRNVSFNELQNRVLLIVNVAPF